MSKHPFLKLQSSQSLEDLLAQPSTRNSQNWLLTYLDVFVLMVMLVITLITISNINTERQQADAKKPQAVKAKKTPIAPSLPEVTSADTLTPPSPTVNEERAQKIALSENKAAPNPNMSNIILNSTESNNAAPIPATIPENKVAPDATADSIAKPIYKSQAIINSTEENELQQHLTKTVAEFGLDKNVNIKVAQGYAQLEIQDNVLFNSSEADLTASGGVLLKRLMPLLKQSVGLILIEGHTDNMPIKTAQFPSNWELGAYRATSVLHFLVLQQLDSNRLRAITYADTMPIADNSTPEGREKNRRVNILIKFSEQ
ncbi:MAG: OmpA/MotB family protein [Methylobacter sp.]